ncbi:MAG: type VI secretion system baseplate subunit TssG [Planctomycetota bacterium]|nr:type VI secretion system baseplate subunit TssG [Planctomycetota bacterium]
MGRQGRTTPGPLGAGTGGRSPGAPGPGANGAPDPLEELLRAEPEPEHAPAETRRPIDRAEREDLWDRLNVRAWGHDFFALARRIEALHPEFPGFGASSRASDDPVRFAQEPTLAFPPCTVSQFHFPKSTAPARLFVHFLGLLGPMGPLPLHFTEHALQRELHFKDRTFSRFLDVFNHRMVSLFYRSWAASQMPASYDRALPVENADELDDATRDRYLAGDADRYAVYVGSLFGLGGEETRLRDAVPDIGKLHFSGRLATPGRGPEGLCAILSKYFGVEVEVEEFAGRWLDLPEQYWCRLGAPGPSSTLGTTSGGMIVAGNRVWDCQGMFRIRLGPMSLADYQRLLPDGRAARRLDAWIRNYLGDEFSWEAVLALKASEVPPTRLGGDARLGWTTWVRCGENTEDRDELVIRSTR